MYRILEFLSRHANTLLFFILEAICIWLIIINNSYQGALAFNTSNRWVGEFLTKSHELNEYLNLRDVNKELAADNAFLRTQLQKRITTFDTTTSALTDSVVLAKYQFVMAKVINNSTSRTENYITLNKGSQDEITPGMAVICAKGVVGMVKHVSRHFCTVNSLLHSKVFVPSKVKKYDVSGSVSWDGIDFRKGLMQNVPRHVKVKVGDTIVTSGLSHVYPEGIPVGVVSKIDLRGDESFYRLTIDFTTDFSRINYVYVVKNRLEHEVDSLEIKTYTSDKKDHR